MPRRDAWREAIERASTPPPPRLLPGLQATSILASAARDPDVVSAFLDVVRELASKEPMLKSIHLDEFSDGLTMTVEHWGVRALISSLRDSLQPAPNYMELRFFDEHAQPPQEYVVTLRRSTGKTPHELRVEAEQERDAARTQRDEAWAELAVRPDPTPSPFCRALIAASARASVDPSKVVCQECRRRVCTFPDGKLRPHGIPGITRRCPGSGTY